MVWDEKLASEVGEFFAYEPRVASVNHESGSKSDPFGRIHKFSGGSGYYFMVTVYARLAEADKFMPYICDDKTEQPSASMVLRAAFGNLAAKYDDSAPHGARFLKMAQDAYAKAAQAIPNKAKQSRLDQVLRRFDLIFAGAIRSADSDEDD